MNKNNFYLKTRQSWVKDNPARTEKELAAIGYIHDMPLGKGKAAIRTVLSIDLFTAPVAWRAQIAFIGINGQAVPVNRWSLAEHKSAREFAEYMLQGVGLKLQAIAKLDEWSFELAYPVTPDEAEHVARTALRPDRDFVPLPVGEINEYDFNNRKLQVGDGLYQPQKRSKLYERGN